MRWAHSYACLLACVLTIGCGDKQQPVPTAKKPNGEVTSAVEAAQSTSLGTKPSTVKEAPKGVSPASSALSFPPASRVFAIDLDGDGTEEVLGAKSGTLWAHRIHKSGGSTELWSVEGEGTVHRVVAVPATGQLKRRLVVARGVGRGRLKAPLVLAFLDPSTGAAQAPPILRNEGPRNEPAHLSVTDVDRDGAPEIAFAYFKSKYFVQARHYELDGRPVAANTRSEAIRMATSRVYGDLNGEGGADEIIGRVYGDARGLPGDLKVDLGSGHMAVATDKGVRGLLFARIGDETKPALYFADGWVANYGKDAKATLKRLSWTAKGFSSSLVGRSPEEFTFFDLQAVDIDGDGKQEIAARGNKQLTIFERAEKKWSQWTAARFEPVINVAIGRGGDGVWRVFIPGDTGARSVAVVKP